MKVKLLAPACFWSLSPEERSRVGNGCGPSGWKDVGFDPIPDDPFGFNVHEACRIHDFMYECGTTPDDRRCADDIFEENIGRIMEAY